jgi:hypothetical protein
VNWRRGLFRLWIVGSALFVLAVVFIHYPSIKAEFIAPANKPDLAVNAKLADEVYQRFYSDMPREEFDEKISDPKVIARIEAIVKKIDTSRPLSQWTDDELLASMALPNGPFPKPLDERGHSDSHRTRHSVSGPGSRNIPGVGFERVRCYTELNV